MKIKRKKQMNLTDAINHAMDNEKGVYYITTDGEGHVMLDGSNQVEIIDVFAHDKFIVEVEERVTELTHFEEIVIVMMSGKVVTFKNINLKSIYKSEISTIYAQIDGKLQLIWDVDDE